MERRLAKGSHGDSCPTLEEYWGAGWEGEGMVELHPRLVVMKGTLGQR